MILIVDDDVSFTYAVWRYLESKGYRVHTANGSTEAAKAMETNRFDVIVTDIKFGRKEPDGLELARAIRRDHPSLPVICVTAYPELVKARLSDMPVFYKPVELAALRQAIDERLAA
jgi:two-component system response regulator GlrR